MARMRDKKKARRVTIPGMAGVEGRVTVAEGEYLVEVSEVTQEEGGSADYLKWVFEITGKLHNGASLFYNTSFAPQALWNLRSLLEALQFEVPDDDLDMDPTEFVGLKLMVSVEHDTYEGKKQAKIVDFWPAPEGSAEQNEDEPKSRKARDDDEEKKSSRKSRRSRRQREDDEDNDAGAEQNEDEPKSRRGKKSRDKKKPALVSQDDLADMKQDELEDVVERLGLDLDLTDYPTLRKMRNAVIDAAEEAGVLEE